MSNKTCGECRYMLHKDAFEVCTHSMTETSMFNEACKHFTPPTNGDVIRQGGNQVLAEFQSKLSCEVCAYANTGCYAPAGRPSDCKSGVLAWLNAPACVKQNGDHDTQTDLCCNDDTQKEVKDE